MNEQAPESTNIGSNTASGGFGNRLRAAREAANLSPLQAAERLHCDPNVVAALENEDTAWLGASVFVRGHLRRYADLLQLPTDELLALYERKNDSPANLPDLASIPRAERPRDPNKALRWLYLVGAGLLGLFAVWAVLQNPRRGESTPAPSPNNNAPAPTPQLSGGAAATVNSQAAAATPAEPAALPAPSASGVGAASALAPLAGVATSVSSTALPATTLPTAGLPAAAPSTAPLPTSAPAAANGIGSPTIPNAASANNLVKMTLVSVADCWTEVYDFEGRQLYFNTARRGSRHEISGKAPLRVVIGNARAVRFEIDGRELGIPETLQRKGTAFITVAADGRMEQAQ